MSDFRIQAAYGLTGDQPEAVAALSEGVIRGDRFQTLLGVTGSGKTFTMANVIERVRKPDARHRAQQDAGRPALQRVPRVPARQRGRVLRQLLRLLPARGLRAGAGPLHREGLVHQRRDRPPAPRCHDVALSPPRRGHRRQRELHLRPGLARGLPREDGARCRSVRRSSATRCCASSSTSSTRATTSSPRAASSACAATRWRSGPPHRTPPSASQLWGDEVEQIVSFDPVSGEVLEKPAHAAIYPATHFVTNDPAVERSLVEIRREMDERCAWFEEHGKVLEAHRLRQRTQYDMEMLREMGYCSGIENYSRILLGKEPGATPNCLLDYFPDDFLCFVDESHMSLPQIRAMSEGDKSRKQQLVDYGFRLPSALDNRPLRFAEFLDKVPQLIFVSATPGEFELGQQREHRRADHPPHRPRRPRGPGAAHRGPDRRPHERDPPASRQGPARARHHAHQAHGRGPHRLPARERLQGALPAQRGRHPGAHPDRARPAVGGVRRPRGHQPPARRARSPRGHAGRHPRRRQGGLPARPDQPHPDHRPRGPQHRRHRHHVRGQGHGGDGGGDRRDGPPAHQADGVQPRSTASHR